MDISEILGVILIAMVLATIVWLVWLVKAYSDRVTKYLKTRMDESQWKQVMTLAQTIVYFVEQSPQFRDYSSEDKKERAIMELRGWLGQRGIAVELDEIDKVIEAAVATMNGVLTPFDVIHTITPAESDVYGATLTGESNAALFSHQMRPVTQSEMAKVQKQ